MPTSSTAGWLAVAEAGGAVSGCAVMAVPCGESALEELEPGAATSEQPRQEERERDEQDRADEHQGADGVDGGLYAEADRRVDPHRQRLRAHTGGEEGEDEVVEDQREDEDRRGEHGRPHQRQRDEPDGLRTGR